MKIGSSDSNCLGPDKEGPLRQDGIVDPDIALPNPDKSTSKTLQLRIFRRLGVIEDVTFGEVLVSTGKACSQLPKVPLQRFFNTPARFRYVFLQLAGILMNRRLRVESEHK